MPLNHSISGALMADLSGVSALHELSTTVHFYETEISQLGPSHVFHHGVGINMTHVTLMTSSLLSKCYISWTFTIKCHSKMRQNIEVQQLCKQHIFYTMQNLINFFHYVTPHNTFDRYNTKHNHWQHSAASILLQDSLWINRKRT